MFCKHCHLYLHDILQIINHGIEAQILQEVKENSAKFLELPIEEKNKYSMASDDVQGFGQVYVVSEEQKLDWADLFILVVYPTKFRKWTFWPTTPPEFMYVILVL